MNLLNFNIFIFTLFYNTLPSFCLNFIGRKSQLTKILSENKKQINDLQTKYSWNEEWFEEMPVDHFSYRDSRKFKLR